jgi:hypothetical protein
MKSQVFIIALFMLTINVCLTSCEKAFIKPNQASKDPYANFEYLWKQCDEKYSFFELKQVDWKKVHDDYKAKIYTGISDDSLFSVMGSMLNELRDDHSNLISYFNVSAYRNSLKVQPNIFWRTITDNYLNKSFVTTGPFVHDFLSNGRVGYIRFAAFTGQINSGNLNYVLNRYANTKGIILDMRGNGGGAVSDVFALLSRFVEQETTVFKVRIKSGTGHNEFSNPEDARVKPASGSSFKGKVILLIDRGTYSAGSFTALGMKALPNITLMGDTTGGGLGLPNGGQLPNGWTYRFSITQTLGLNGENFENGVPPDIYQLFDWNDLSRDEVLDAAMDELLK